MDQHDTYAFSALLARMKYITRWGLMRSTWSENLSEHTTETAHLSHILALIARDIFGEEVRPETITVTALYHDASEILTGDMPTPVKYKNNELKAAYKSVEAQSAKSLASLLPPALNSTLEPYLTGEVLQEEEARLLKAADRLAALIKCITEEASGNTEFRSAKKQQLEQLAAMHCPAADYFIEHFLPCYTADLDELAGGIL